MIDLHAHTTASDGTCSPAELVALAEDAGLEALAITDHDTVDGVLEAHLAAKTLHVVAGIELSSSHEGRNVHILGLFLDISRPELIQTLSGFRADRLDRARRMVEKLNHLGYGISLQDVLDQAEDGVVGRPHVARALVAGGWVPDVHSAFSPGLIGDGGRADVSRTLLSVFDAVALVRDWGGVAVLAHPGIADGITEELVSALARWGLTGIEADYPLHTQQTRDHYRSLAARLGLAVTGGSDFHGPQSANGSPLGTCSTTRESFARLEDAAHTTSR
jgi:hypothetical protein